MILHFLPAQFYADEELAGIAVRKNGLALKYADPKFQADLAMVLLAVNQDISFIRYAHTSLFNEKELDFIWEMPVWANFKKKELEFSKKRI